MTYDEYPTEVKFGLACAELARSFAADTAPDPGRALAIAGFFLTSFAAAVYQAEPVDKQALMATFMQMSGHEARKGAEAFIKKCTATFLTNALERKVAGGGI